MQNENPLIVQSDRSILLETASPRYSEARDTLAFFAELEKCPEHIHTYTITALSLWNAAAAGHTADDIIVFLRAYSKYEVPANIIHDIQEIIGRYGKLVLNRVDNTLQLTSDDPLLLEEVAAHKAIQPLIEEVHDSSCLIIAPLSRGHLKQAMIKIGYPVVDRAGYREGEPLTLTLEPRLPNNTAFALRDYQREAVNAFFKNGDISGGCGVLVLPCGAGKTVIGIGVLAQAACQTLIITTNITATRQWIHELIEKTTLTENDVGEYSGERKDIKPVTVVTYNILTYRKNKEDDFIHFGIFNRRNWGLIIYDEVHLIPAPVFRSVAELQSTRRLGLTATLVREDGKEDDVFSLIGPKRYDVPWRDLEKAGWIANAVCAEIRVQLPEEVRVPYVTATPREKYKIASCNPTKWDVIRCLLERHQDDSVLIIGQYLDQLRTVQELTNAPLITGKTKSRRRDELYSGFKHREFNVLVVSKVANFAIDLPDANVAIQISGTFGSRQEEAQRLGRILRPKRGANQAHFYTIVTRDTPDQVYAEKRQLFLAEQGYGYSIVNFAADKEDPLLPN